MLYVKGMGVFLPPIRTSIADLRSEAGLRDSEVAFFGKFLGLGTICDARDVSLSDMLCTAADGALAGGDPSRVDHLVLAHTTQQAVQPARQVPAVLRERLGLPRACAFSLSQMNCVAGLYALVVAEALLAAGPPGREALLLAGDKVESEAMRVIPGATVLGDAAAACRVGLDPGGDAVLAVVQRTLGEFHEGHATDDALRLRYQRLYLPTLCGVVEEACAQAGVPLSEVALILPHNVNIYSWRQAAARLGISTDKVFLANVPLTGHCFGADPFVNLATARAHGVLEPGDHVVLASAGLGATFASAVLSIGAREVTA